MWRNSTSGILHHIMIESTKQCFVNITFFQRRIILRLLETEASTSSLKFWFFDLSKKQDLTRWPYFLPSVYEVYFQFVCLSIRARGTPVSGPRFLPRRRGREGVGVGVPWSGILCLWQGRGYPPLPPTKTGHSAFAVSCYRTFSLKMKFRQKCKIQKKWLELLKNKLFSSVSLGLLWTKSDYCTFCTDASSFKPRSQNIMFTPGANCWIEDRVLNISLLDWKKLFCYSHRLKANKF